MRKKVLGLAAACAFAALLTVGASLAYFTDQETAGNVVTTGNVNIAIDENATLEWYEDHKEEEKFHWSVKKTADGSGLSYEGIVPGDKVSHVVDIFNIGKNDAYLRIKVKPKLTNAEGKEVSAEGIQYWMVQEEKLPEQTDKDGYSIFYYDKILKIYEEGNNDDDVYRLMDWISFPSSWGNAYAGVKLEIEVIAEAVQSDNVDVGDLKGVEAAKKAFETAGTTIEKYERK